MRGGNRLRNKERRKKDWGEKTGEDIRRIEEREKILGE